MQGFKHNNEYFKSENDETETYTISKRCQLMDEQTMT